MSAKFYLGGGRCEKKVWVSGGEKNQIASIYLNTQDVYKHIHKYTHIHTYIHLSTHTSVALSRGRGNRAPKGYIDYI